MRFSWCLVKLELKCTSKTPNTVGYIRRMRSIDFSEQRALRRDLLFAGGAHRKRKKTPFRHRTVDDLRRLNTYLVVLGIWVRFVQNLFKNSTLGETLQLLQPFLWRSVRHSSPITSNLSFYLGIRISFRSWRGNFNDSSAHGLNEESPIFLRLEKANNQRRNTLLWLKPTAQIFILSQKAVEFNLLILSVKFKGELAVTGIRLQQKVHFSRCHGILISDPQFESTLIKSFYSFPLCYALNLMLRERIFTLLSLKENDNSNFINKNDS